MKIVSNTKQIERNVKITKYVTFGSLLILGVGIYFSLTQQDKPNTVYITFSTLVIGFILSQISIYMQVRWGKSPRPDESITAQLKGLDDKYTLYIYTSPLPFLIVSTNGIWGLITYHQEGTITYTKDKWHQRGGNVFRKLFGADKLGRPDLDHRNQQADYFRSFAKIAPGFDMPPLNTALVFTHPTVSIDAENAPLPTIPIKKLKELVRKKSKNEAIAPETIAYINALLVK